METATRAYNRVASQTQRDEWIVKHLFLVRHVLGRLTAELPRGVDVENLEAAGTLGLVEAANSFKADQGAKFATYARHRVRGAMLDELRRNSPIPQHLFANLTLVRKAYRSLPMPVTVDKLAAATGLTDDQISDCLAAMRLTRLQSLDQNPDHASDQPDERQERPEARLDHAEQRHLLAEALEALPEQARLVVTLSYLEDLRLKEIGAVLRLSESRVCRLLSQALFTLGEYMRSREA
jgi:RNA polymerase sigma factor for flagellar operon FliA